MHQHESISATELARNIAQNLDKVRMSGQSLYITKGTRIIAKLSPPPKVGFPIAKLAQLLNSLPKLDDDSKAMTKDLSTIRTNAKLPKSPWE